MKPTFLLGAVGIIVALWPAENLLLKMIFATIVLMTAALPLMVKVKHITWISTGLVLILTGVFISLNSVRKFDSVDSYMKLLPRDSEVRYADVEALSKEFGVEGWMPYFIVWRRNALPEVMTIAGLLPMSRE